MTGAFVSDLALYVTRVARASQRKTKALGAPSREHQSFDSYLPNALHFLLSNIPSALPVVAIPPYYCLFCCAVPPVPSQTRTSKSIDHERLRTTMTMMCENNEWADTTMWVMLLFCTFQDVDNESSPSSKKKNGAAVKEE
jgi:hypothetical protein